MDENTPDDSLGKFSEIISDLSRQASEIVQASAIFEPAGFGTAHTPERNDQMADPEIRRLDDRIDAASRESQLRLDAAMARIDGKIDRILERTDGMNASLNALSGRLDNVRSLIIVTAVASVLAIVAAVFAGEALWAGGFSSGQSDRQPPATLSTQSQSPERR